jgi:hypothetical protein
MSPFSMSLCVSSSLGSRPEPFADMSLCFLLTLFCLLGRSSFFYRDGRELHPEATLPSLSSDEAGFAQLSCPFLMQ